MQEYKFLLCDVDTKALEAVHPLCRGLVTKGGVVPSLLPPKVLYQLFSLADIQEEVAVLTLVGQVLYFHVICHSSLTLFMLFFCSTLLLKCLFASVTALLTLYAAAL